MATNSNPLRETGLDECSINFLYICFGHTQHLSVETSLAAIHTQLQKLGMLTRSQPSRATPKMELTFRHDCDYADIAIPATTAREPIDDEYVSFHKPLETPLQ